MKPFVDGPRGVSNPRGIRIDLQSALTRSPIRTSSFPAWCEVSLAMANRIAEMNLLFVPIQHRALQSPPLTTHFFRLLHPSCPPFSVSTSSFGGLLVPQTHGQTGIYAAVMP